jgi:putative colanic acid biosynthesis acetyltransferase WcaF
MTGPARDSPHSAGNRLARVLWAIVYRVLFRTSPRPCHAWRNWLLRVFGARLHPTARVYPTAKVWAPWLLEMGERATLGDDVDCYCVGGVTIGAFTTVSQYTFLCGATHDADLESFPLVPRPVRIGAWCWIAADVFVAPGVTIGDGVVVGARSGVFRDLPAWVFAAGTPARVVRPRARPRPDDATNRAAEGAKSGGASVR